MFELLKTVISRGGYKLEELQGKVKKLFVLGDLTEEQTDELLEMASGGISPEAERPETLSMIRTLAEKIEELKARVETLEGGGKEPEEYPDWKPWDGISNDYQNGAIVRHKGQLWQSVYEGQNVWEPGALGTSAMWVKYEA